VVGRAVASALQTKHELVIIDPKYNNNKITDHVDADGIIICVSTPTTEDGICDVNNIANVLDHVPFFMPVMIKSTLTPPNVQGFKEIYENHSIVYSPEFLRATSANTDFLNQKYVVLGGEDPECFWQELFQTTLPNCKLIFNCSAIEASMVKYTVNSFLATKVAFFNSIYDICQKNNADYDIVRHIATHDSRIGNSHTLVPGLDGERGFGGHCFPKDTSAFIKYSKSLNTPLEILEAVVDYNGKIRKNIT
jgi:nucleotide sugar dehydrogenase